MSEASSRGLSLHTKILLGLVLGASLGLLANHYATLVQQEQLGQAGEAGGVAALALKQQMEMQPGRGVPWLDHLLTYLLDPIGKIFLNMLIMTVIPLVFCSLAVGVAKLGDLRSLGRVGAKTFAYFVGTMAVGVVIGLSLVNTVQPGARIDEETRGTLKRKAESERNDLTSKKVTFGVDTFVNIVTRNPIKSAAEMDMLGVIFFALLVGAGLTRIPPERARTVIDALEGFNEVLVFIIDLAMKLAPYGVFAFLFKVTFTMGFSVLISLGLYVVVVIIGLGLQMFGVFPILVRVFSGMSPLFFFRKVRAVILTAFSTSSSNATLPTSIKITQEELGVPRQIAGFVLPLGATMNMNGTALFEGVTVLFLAQIYDVPLDLGQQLIVVILSVLTAIGAAGVPGGSIPLLMMIMASVGVPPEGLAIILGVDRILDMCRTTLNVVGDITCATFIARSEGAVLPGTVGAPALEGSPES